MFCQKYGTVTILSLKESIEIISHIGESDNNEEPDVINSFTASTNGINIITHHKSGLFKLWNWKGITTIKMDF